MKIQVGELYNYKTNKKNKDLPSRYRFNHRFYCNCNIEEIIDIGKELFRVKCYDCGSTCRYGSISAYLKFRVKTSKEKLIAL